MLALLGAWWDSPDDVENWDTILPHTARVTGWHRDTEVTTMVRFVLFFHIVTLSQGQRKSKKHVFAFTHADESVTMVEVLAACDGQPSMSMRWVASLPAAVLCDWNVEVCTVE